MLVLTYVALRVVPPEAVPALLNAALQALKIAPTIRHASALV
ncbi:hypothetical protein AB0454_37105 [Streptomyces sp. NPDC093509]